jgi:hypothetical protein
MLDDVTTLSNEEIWAKVMGHAKHANKEIDEFTIALIEQIVGPKKYQWKRTAVNSTEYQENEFVEFSGRVLEANSQLNLLKHLGYSKTFMAEKLLRGLSSNEWSRMIVRTEVDRENHCLEYEILMTREQFDRLRIAKNDIVYGLIKPSRHLLGSFWHLNKSAKA